MTATAVSGSCYKVPLKPISPIQLFDEQVERLIRKNYHCSIGMDEEMFKTELMKPLLENLGKYYDKPDNLLVDYGTHIPFVIVFPHTVIERQTQAALIFNKPESVQYKLKEPNINRKPRSDKPYLAINVDPGTQLQGMPIHICIDQINAQRRGGLTLDEGLAIATHHTDILLSHGIDCTGTVTSDKVTIPYIQYKNDKIVIGKHFPHVPPPPPPDRFGSGSLAGMIIVR